MLLTKYIKNLLIETINNKDEELVRLYNNGVSTQELAKKFGVNKQSILNRLTYLKKKKGYVVKPRKVNLDHKEFVRVFNTANNISDIANFFGISNIAVRQLASGIRKNEPELNIKTFGASKIEISNKELAKLANETDTLKELEAKTGLTQIQLTNKLKKLRKQGYKVKLFQSKLSKNKDAMKLLGILPDEEIAAMSGIKMQSIIKMRKKLGIMQAPKISLSKEQLNFYIEHIFELWQLIPDEFELTKLIHIMPDRIVNEIEKNRHARPKNENYAKQVISFINKWNNAQSVKAFIRETLLRRDKVLDFINKLRMLKIDVKKHADE